MYNAMIIASYIILLLNGFVGFQWAEDGTPTSLWVNNLVVMHYNQYIYQF